MRSKDPIEVVIESIAEDGCGYSADGHQAVFGALPGETVLADPVSKKRKKLYLRAKEITNPSPDRVVPACSASNYCGGCSFQHFSHPAQLALKQSMLKELLHPLAPKNWLAPISGNPLHYRSKARIGVKFVEKKERVLVGFREKMKPFIADAENCPVLIEPVSDLTQALATLIQGLTIPRSIPQIELASGDEEIALVFRHMDPFADADVEQLIEFGRHHGLQIYAQPGGVETTHRLFPAQGSDLLSYTLQNQNLSFQFSPQDFTQVNLAVNQLMVDQVLALLDLKSGEQVFDGFCGIGNFSLALAHAGAQVIGAELSQDSILRARDNAERNGLTNVSFQVIDLFDENSEIPGFEKVTKVLLDPPRSGAEQLVKKFASTDVSRVVYVSCNPSTLARDLKALVEQGFELESAGIIDMFPHTTHVESVALLTRPVGRPESVL
jgi:23S rRNA (uracil1939-C5)-methyltransferase